MMATPLRRLIVRPWSWVGFLGAGGLAVLLAAWVTAEPPASPGERFGVDRLRIMRTAGGHLLDFRYRVVDPRLAASLLTKEARGHVVDEKTGARLAVPDMPKAGPLRNTGVAHAGRTYFALFNNPGGLVRRGDRVSVVLGGLTARLTVE